MRVQACARGGEAHPACGGAALLRAATPLGRAATVALLRRSCCALLGCGCSALSGGGQPALFARSCCNLLGGGWPALLGRERHVQPELCRQLLVTVQAVTGGTGSRVGARGAPSRVAGHAHGACRVSRWWHERSVLWTARLPLGAAALPQPQPAPTASPPAPAIPPTQQPAHPTSNPPTRTPTQPPAPEVHPPHTAVGVYLHAQRLHVVCAVRPLAQVLPGWGGGEETHAGECGPSLGWPRGRQLG